MFWKQKNIIPNAAPKTAKKKINNKKINNPIKTSIISPFFALQIGHLFIFLKTPNLFFFVVLSFAFLLLYNKNLNI